jgi:probable rRNA maturation factor
MLWRETIPTHVALDAAGRRTEVSVVLADDALVRRLNRQWRRIDSSTNVLSFPSLDEELPPKAPSLLGDVVLAFETVSREAQEQGKELADHMRHLVVHGILHLLGEVEPKDVEIGMKVEAVWKPAKEREGAITDIRYFRPRR